jgi:hypothetical protein
MASTQSTPPVQWHPDRTTGPGGPFALTCTRTNLRTHADTRSASQSKLLRIGSAQHCVQAAAPTGNLGPKARGQWCGGPRVAQPRANGADRGPRLRLGGRSVLRPAGGSPLTRQWLEQRLLVH